MITTIEDIDFTIKQVCSSTFMEFKVQIANKLLSIKNSVDSKIKSIAIDKLEKQIKAIEDLSSEVLPILSNKRTRQERLTNDESDEEYILYNKKKARENSRSFITIICHNGIEVYVPWFDNHIKMNLFIDKICDLYDISSRNMLKRRYGYDTCSNIAAVYEVIRMNNTRQEIIDRFMNYINKIE